MDPEPERRINAEFRRSGEWYHAGDAVIVGEVEVGADSSIWYGAVLRGDDAPIRVGRRVNLQDQTVLHPDPDVPLVIEDDVTVGHRALLHCAAIGSGCLIGMGAILLEGVRVESGSLVAAGSVVPPHTHVPPHSLVRGVPGRVVRATTPEERAHIAYSVEKYVGVAREFFARYGGEPGD